ETMTVSAELTRRLEDLARKEGVTMFMLLVAAFKVLLHRYSRQDDICVGTPVANRRQEELEHIIGLFINTLVLRTDLSNNPTFRELLQRVKNVTLEAYQHQDIPFEMIVDSLQLDRDMSHTPLFQVMFILQNAPVKAHALPGVQLEQIHVDMGTSTFDLTFSISQSVRGMSVSVEYNTDLFDASTIQRMLSHYHTLLQSVVENPDERIGLLNILPEEERRKVLIEWNATEEPRPENLCAHHLFEYRVLENPDAVAVAYLGQYLSYAELNQRANQLAHYLIRAGVRPEVKVGICMDKSLEMIVSVLGVMKAGGAYVPIDPAYPQERIAYMLEDSGVPILLTSAEVRSNLPPFEGHIIAVDAEWEEISGEPDNNPAVDMEPDNLVYMIYTSGTTGKAKGTMISHRSLVNAYFGWEKVFGLRETQHAHLQMANFSFDVFSGDFVRALCSGGKLVLVPREYLLDAPRLYELMRKEHVTIAEFVPAVLRNLIQHLEDIEQKLDFMRVLIAGSDVWYVSEYKKFLDFIGPDTRLLNTFGLTEATIDSSYFEARDLNLPLERLVPIGVPFPNTQIYILDEFLNPVPIGVPGEVCVGGMNLARGYHNRQDLTAEKFVANPYSEKGERLYRTGDLARFLPDGNIEFLGRIDHQVKVRGFRIELGEVETALTKHPGVKEGVVIVREDSPGDKRLVGYVVPHDPENFSVSDLRKFLMEKLPDYMVPSAFVVLEQLPLTPNGKVDRKALPKPDRIVRDDDEPFVAPRNELEEKIAEVWKEVLDVEQVSVTDNFFLIGGHSLLATQLVSRLREVLDVEVPLRKVFENPTVAGLAEFVESARRVEKGLEAPPIVPVPRDQELPLSFAQERLWFLDQLEPNSPFYNIPEAFRIKGKLDFALLEKAVNEVLRRHESLRTTFHAVDGKPRMVIHDAYQLSLDIEDFRDMPREKREKAIRELLHRTATTPIPLDTLPLFRVKVARESDTSSVIILVMHHIISDDWSIKVLMREIAVIYNALRHHQPIPLPELKIQYADFAHWQRNWLQGEVMEAHLNFWKNYLKDAPPLLELPTDR
ncbi:MAG TPA: amino acid adenylation domain-containing protein, partial [Calditrichae bacterium]|nr:amino acid adenylation domain-containing protein [Calditrichia bacterium]